MTKPISTQVHGVLDYLSAGTLLALPRMLNWGSAITNVLTVAGASTVVYSLLTRYELGAAKVLPMHTHLALDGINGALVATLPLIFPRDNKNTAMLVSLGLFEVAASMLTESKSLIEHEYTMSSGQMRLV